MKDELLVGGIGTALSAVGTATQVNELLQIISLIITIVGGIISFIVLPLITWFINAKKDGKIDKKEITDAVGIISDGASKIKEDLDKKNKE